MIREIILPDKMNIILYLASSYAAALSIYIPYTIKPHFIHDPLMHPRHVFDMLACMVAVPFGSYFLLKLITKRRAKA